jgi:threonine aldolase
MKRRSFLAAPLAAPFVPQIAKGAAEERVYAFGDGVPLGPAEYAQLLVRLATPARDRGLERVTFEEIGPDEYSRGGVVQALEARMAAILGKEAAIWMPTGTLANHFAVRYLAGSKRRVLVQAESHLYNDCGDCAQTLSGLTLMPLAPGKATFTLADVEQAAGASLLGRVPVPVGAIQIESPVRRRTGARFDFEEMKKISAWARSRKIGLHLDGARLFLESAYTNRPVREYAALFDTVYISMYKYFNAASGAILAGPKDLLANLADQRRMFGGGLYHVWPFAAVALHYMDGFEQRLRTGIENSERVIETLRKEGNFEIERIPDGTNIFRLRPTSVNPPVYLGRLEAAGISARPPVGDWFNFQVNETWGRVPATEIIHRFEKALG